MVDRYIARHTYVFIQGFSKIVISPTAILEITGSSITSVSGIDDYEVVNNGGGAGAESGGSVVKQKVGSIIHNHPEYSEDEEGVHPSLRPQRAGLIAEKAPTKFSDKYVTLRTCFF